MKGMHWKGYEIGTVEVASFAERCFFVTETGSRDSQCSGCGGCVNSKTLRVEPVLFDD